MGSARIVVTIVLAGGLATTAGLVQATPLAAFQQPAAPASRMVGSITAIDGKTLTIKPDTGDPAKVTVSDTARVLQTAPGAKTLTGATPIQFSDLAIGDRVLVALHPATDGSTPMATTVVAIKQAAIAQMQQADQADWQKRGVGGMVKAVDADAGTVTISSGSRMLAIHASAKTIVHRYSPDSIKFSDAKPSTLAQIHAGDQLRARGERDGMDVNAEEIIAGSFRNIAATVISIDAASNSLTVNDLATKKPVVIHITSDSQMHKLPATMAQMIAARFKRDNSGTGNGNTPATRPADSGNGQARSGDSSQFLQRTPTVSLADLHKGDAVMIVATQGTPDAATAVTLLAGVEPILTASPSASQSVFSASWNLGGGGGEESGTP
jgi:Cu/Ag efflux protein CusF